MLKIAPNLPKFDAICLLMHKIFFVWYLIDIIFVRNSFSINIWCLPLLFILSLFHFACFFSPIRSSPVRRNHSAASRCSLCTFSVKYVWFSASITFEIIICYSSQFYFALGLFCDALVIDSSQIRIKIDDEPNFYQFFLLLLLWWSFIQWKYT